MEMVEMVTSRKEKGWTDLEKLTEIKTSIHYAANHIGKLAHQREVTAIKKSTGKKNRRMPGKYIQVLSRQQQTHYQEIHSSEKD